MLVATTVGKEPKTALSGVVENPGSFLFIETETESFLHPIITRLSDGKLSTLSDLSHYQGTGSWRPREETYLRRRNPSKPILLVLPLLNFSDGLLTLVPLPFHPMTDVGPPRVARTNSL